MKRILKEAPLLEMRMKGSLHPVLKKIVHIMMLSQAPGMKTLILDLLALRQS